MLVFCFTVTRPKKNDIPIDTVYSELSKKSTISTNNIPRYLPYEGGGGGTYLCCVENTVDVVEICNKYNYEIGTIYTLEIDNETYNNNFTVFPTYSKDGAKYTLNSHNSYINE